jgi:hypothetical protein
VASDRSPTVPNHDLVHECATDDNIPNHPPIAILPVRVDPDLLAEDKIRQSLSASLRGILSPLRSVDRVQPDSDLLPINQDRDRIAICDADHLALKVGWFSLEVKRRRADRTLASSCLFSEVCLAMSSSETIRSSWLIPFLVNLTACLKPSAPDVFVVLRCHDDVEREYPHLPQYPT